MIVGDDAVVNKLAADLDTKVLRSTLIASNIAKMYRCNCWPRDSAK
jgi:hypothetical protein